MVKTLASFLVMYINSVRTFLKITFCEKVSWPLLIKISLIKLERTQIRNWKRIWCHMVTITYSVSIKGVYTSRSSNTRLYKDLIKRLGKLRIDACAIRGFFLVFFCINNILFLYTFPKSLRAHRVGSRKLNITKEKTFTEWSLYKHKTKRNKTKQNKKLYNYK